MKLPRSLPVPHVERVLPALEAGPHHVRARPRLLALLAAPGRLALARARCRGRRACAARSAAVPGSDCAIRSRALLGDLLDLDEVADLVTAALQRTASSVHATADAAEAERSSVRGAPLDRIADRAASPSGPSRDLDGLGLSSAAAVAASAFATRSARPSPPPAGCRAARLPRSFATLSAGAAPAAPSRPPGTTLIGFDVPSDFVSTS